MEPSEASGSIYRRASSEEMVLVSKGGVGCPGVPQQRFEANAADRMEKSVHKKCNEL